MSILGLLSFGAGVVILPYLYLFGCYTHNIPLQQDRAQELDQTLSLMAGIGYVRMEEVPGIPRLAQTPGVMIYAPLADTPVDPREGT